MQATPNFFITLVSQLGMHLPSLIVAIIGCVVVGNRWRVLGNAAAPALGGLLLLIFLHLASPVLYAAIAGSPGDVQAVSKWYRMIGFATSFCSAAALGLLIMGISLGRTNPGAPTLPTPPDRFGN